MKKINSLPDTRHDRRHFLRNVSYGIGAASMLLPQFSALAGPDLFSGTTLPGPSGATLDALQGGKKLGIALVGLGKYSEGELAPALEQTKLCKLAGIVTGTPDKARKWKEKYRIPDKNIYNYQTFDQIADNKDIDIVYVVLPNPLHAEYVIRAAKAGKHVICEKPMGMNAEECRQMMDACQQAGKKLSVGYRLHFEPHHQELMRLGQKEVFGKVNRIIAQNAQKQSNDTPWRLGGGVGGGGPLRDVGIYCIQGAIYTKGEIPVSVTAKYHPVTDPEKFNKVEEGMDFQLQFADGSVADCKTSYNAKLNKLRAEAAQGWMELDPAYEYKGLKGKTSKGEMDLPNVAQQAFQMDDFAHCIINNQPTRVPGEMGLRDVQLIESVFQAAKSGKKVSTQHVRNVLDAVGNR